MNTLFRNLSFVIIAVLFVALLSGCAGLHKNTEHLLTSAGFQTRTPSTPQEKEAYERMEPYKLKRGDVSGKVVYSYKDPKQGVIYLGNEKQYQEYQRLSMQQTAAADKLSQSADMEVSVWGVQNGM